MFIIHSFKLIKETIYTSERTIIDADFKDAQLLVLLEEKNQLAIELNQIHLMNVSKNHYMIRFTKQHFCVLELNLLHFYTLDGVLISTTDVGHHVHHLFPFKEGVICSYGDEGVFGSGLGQNILNFAQPNNALQSLEEIAQLYDFSFDSLFAKFKPLAGLQTTENKLLLFNENFTLQQSFAAPIDLSNTLAFVVTHEAAFFMEEHQIIIWPYTDGENYTVIPNEIKTFPQAVYYREDHYFLEIQKNAILTYSFR